MANREENLKVVSEVLEAPIPVLDTYLLKDKIRAANRPAAAAEFPCDPENARHLRRDGMLPRLDRRAVQQHPTIVAPLHRAELIHESVPAYAGTTWREINNP